MQIKVKTLPKPLLRFLLINLFLIGYAQCKSPVAKIDNTDSTIHQLITFDLKNFHDPTTIRLSEIGATEIEYIPLETTTQNVISQVNNVIFSNSYFLIYGYSSVNMFRHDGSFVTEVGTRGRGPYEFVSVTDIDINPENESIYVTVGNKFLVFNKNGKFIRTFKGPLSGSRMNFKFTEDGFLCYYLNDEGNIVNSYILIDTTGKIIKNYPNRYSWKRKGPGVFYMWENIFYKFSNQLFKKEIYCDTIFSFKNKVFKPHMVIDVGKQRLTPEIRSSIVTRPDFSVTTYQNYITPWNLFEFGDFIYYEMIMTLNGTHDLYSFIGSKKDNFRAMVAPEQGLTNDLDGGPDFWPRTIKNDSTIVSWIEALKFKQYIASDAFKNSSPKYADKKKELEKLAASIQENDNLIVILIKVK
jgi:hypothetical protein